MNQRVNPRLRLILLLASFIWGVGLAEVVARRGFMLPYNPLANGWWEATWLKRSAREGRTEYAIDKFHPTLGWALKENLRGAILFGSVVNSNSQGFRGTKEYTLARGDKTRVVVIGDSLSFGEAVSDDETFAAGIERLVPQTEVINMAVHGYGQDQQLLRLQTEGLKYQPDIVVFGFYQDDVDRNRLSFRDYQKPHYSVVDGRLVLDDRRLVSPEEFKSQFHLRLAYYLDIAMTNLRARRLEEENIERSRKILDELYATSRTIHAPLIQVYLPTPDEVSQNTTDHAGLFSYGCSAAGVFCVDPTPAMNAVIKGRDDWKQLFVNHYAPVLHQAIAEQIARTISSLPKR